MKTQSFRFLWIGQAVANLGDVLLVVGLISILYTLTESVLYLALLPFVNTFGRFISGMISPIIVNKYRLKSVLVWSQISKSAVLLGLSLFVSYKTNPNILIILTLVLVIAFLDGWSMPATNAMLPRLVSNQEIVKANSFVSIVNETTQLGGWALSGVLVALSSGGHVIWITFALFISASYMMHKVVDHTPFQRKKSGDHPIVAMKEGWQLIWRSELFRNLHVMIFFEATANVVWIAAILYVFVTEVLNQTEAWWGYLNTLFFIGLILGGVFCSKFSLVLEKKMRKFLILSSFGVSILTFIFGLISVAWMALVFAAFHGFLEQVKTITVQTYIQKEAAPDELPKLYGAQSALVSLTFGVSSLVFGALAESLGVPYAFFIAGILLAGSTMYVFVRRGSFPEKYEIADR
ncbi:MFS transporter [Halobacillus shinanisalinarum]|uniref:MFS transporter n=1 Tax=Halobacillus shinanisalinarum TaxID=2932258 RepID=A0ABY4H4R7_9BACI|nr:MFS transporter [Halobacillus shinanisalinarum]UOQ95296.1 MFS transporter [Halobacillus shinanisalinarum]